MYCDFPVPIPDKKGKIIFKKKGDAVYVLYEYGRQYNPQKKYAVPQRSIIGKAADELNGQMYPNEKYQEFFPNQPMPEERPVAYRSCCLRIGSYLVVQKVLEEYGLKGMLVEHFGNDAGLFLDLVSYLIVDEENAGQYYPDFAFCHPLFSDEMKVFSDSKVSRFLSGMTKNQIHGFLNSWNKKRDHRQRIYVSYDSTNKNCQSCGIDIVEFGKAKDDKGVPIFNLALAFDRTNRIPLFYEEYPGSINDVAELPFMIDKAKEYGYKNVGFILDRGYFSKENIQYMDKNKYAFILMVKGCKPLCAELIAGIRGTFENDRSCSIRAYREYGTTVTSALFEEDNKKRYFHIYYNPSRHAAEREQLERLLDKEKEHMQKHQGGIWQCPKAYEKYFEPHYDKQGIFLYANEKKEYIEQQLELCGYFCLVTSENITAEAALIHYKSRDMSEKLFQMDKSFIGSKSMRVQSQEAMSAKLLVEFVTLIVRNRIYNLLKGELMRMSESPNYMTVPAAIRELEKIEMVRRNNGRYRLDHAVSKRQRTILNSFGIDEEYVRSKATEIGNMLKTGMSLMDSESEEESDGAEEIDGIDCLL